MSVNPEFEIVPFRSGTSFDLLLSRFYEQEVEFWLDQSSKPHESDLIRVDVEAVRRALKISWTVYQRKDTKWSLVGFRNTKGFSPNFDRHDPINGVAIIDVRQDGEKTDFIDPGVIYFYTFFLLKWEPAGLLTYFKVLDDFDAMLIDKLEFQVCLPTLEQIRALAPRPSLPTASTVKEIEEDRMSRITRTIRYAAQCLFDISKLEKVLIEEAKNDRTLSGEAKRRYIEDITDLCRQTRQGLM